MRRLIFVIAIFLIPALSFAGTATSRWDLTVGGQVKFQFGYADMSAGPMNAGRMDLLVANRPTIPEGQVTKYGTWFYGMADESNVTFRVAGPEAFGAKTSAFVQIRFDGLRVDRVARVVCDKQGEPCTITYTRAGDAWEGASIGVAYARLDWPKTSLLLGAAPPLPGLILTHVGNNLGYGNPHNGIKYRPDILQATLTQKFTKEIEGSIGLLNANSFEADIAGAGTGYTRSNAPFVQGQIKYSSDVCGKIGAWKLTVAVSGFYGKHREFTATDVRDTRNSWEADLKFYVPIIPEKKGNKTGALFLAGTLFTAQDDPHTGPFAAAFGGKQFYWRGNDMAAPVVSGMFLHGGYYFTDKAWINLMYWNTKINWSRHQKNIAIIPQTISRSIRQISGS